MLLSLPMMRTLLSITKFSSFFQTILVRKDMPARAVKTLRNSHNSFSPLPGAAAVFNGGSIGLFYVETLPQWKILSNFELINDSRYDSILDLAYKLFSICSVAIPFIWVSVVVSRSRIIEKSSYDKKVEVHWKKVLRSFFRVWSSAQDQKVWP